MSRGALGRAYRDGEIIMQQGDEGDCMYVLQEGQADVILEAEGREILLRTAQAGEILGEMAIVERVVRSATVRARGDVRALTVDKRTFLRRITEDPSLALKVVENMSRRIRELSDEVGRLKQ